MPVDVIEQRMLALADFGYADWERIFVNSTWGDHDDTIAK